MPRRGWIRRTRSSFRGQLRQGSSGRDLAVDLHELVDPVRAGVARADSFEAVAYEPVSQTTIVQHGTHKLDHLETIARDKVVRSWLEQVLSVVPGRTDEGDPTGQGFER